MTDWVTHHYAVPLGDAYRWEATFEDLPAQLSQQIEQDFGLAWVVELSEVEAVRMMLAMGRCVQSWGMGVLMVPDWHRAEFVSRQSESAGDCVWWELRRVGFATHRAQQVFEAALSRQAPDAGRFSLSSRIQFGH